MRLQLKQMLNLFVADFFILVMCIACQQLTLHVDIFVSICTCTKKHLIWMHKKISGKNLHQNSVNVFLASSRIVVIRFELIVLENFATMHKLFSITVSMDTSMSISSLPSVYVVCTHSSLLLLNNGFTILFIIFCFWNSMLNSIRKPTYSYYLLFILILLATWI